MSNLTSLNVLDVPGWTARVGGPLGRHATVTRSVWFDPVPWTIIASLFTWVVLMARQVPCWQKVVGEVPNSYAGMCYSDIPILYQNRFNMWSGGPLFGDGATPATPAFEYPTLTGGFVWVARWLAERFGAVIGVSATAQDKLAAANIFWAVNAVMLAVCFGFLVWAHLQMGRDSASPHTNGIAVRAWDALFVAAAPTVMLAGLINWDLFAVALTSVGLLLWSRSHPLAAGTVIGLAAAAKFYPFALLAVFLLLCLRAGRLRTWGVFMAGFTVTWLAANLPLMLSNLPGWKYFWTFNAGRGPDLGSLWYVLTLMGIPIPNVSVAELTCLVLGGGFIIGVTLSAPKRPRIGQVALLVMVVFLAFNKVYSPQYVLWLLPFVVLARPVMFDLLVFTVAESLYFFSVWGFLNGVLGIGTGPDRLYWLAVGLRIGVQVWLAARVVRDMWQPWLDPVRGPFVDDPIGGVLNHAPDARWLLYRTLTDQDDETSRWTGSTGSAGSHVVRPDAAVGEPAPGTIIVLTTPRPRHRPHD